MDKRIENFLLLSGIICYVYFLVILFVMGALSPGYDHTLNYISELGAHDSPVMIYANFLLFFVTGLLWALFSVGLLRTLGKGKTWTGKIASMLMIFSAITFMLIAFYPCDPGCNNLTNTGITHGYISNGMVYFALLSLIFLTLGSLKGDFLNKKWFLVFLSVTVLTSVLGYM
ncbi:MAG: DUF998 domain-containing protein, partial [Candidatus Aenigmarchaeota archaeon]|nr:DUF998 domain-containing protein [Candidatus Aenigmarchaeota archaeon]